MQLKQKGIFQQMYCFEKKDSVRLKENYLNMGQTSPSGENIYLNNLYLTKNGKPFCPVMGEAHICRQKNGKTAF